MSDFFVKQNKNVSEKNSGKQVDPWIVKDDGADVVVFSDWYFYGSSLKEFQKLMKVRAPGLRYSILYCFPFQVEEKDIKSNMGKFFVENSIQLEKYIKPGSRVLAMGRANYAVTWETSFHPYTFYDSVWNKTYYFDGDSKSWIFPVDSFFIFFNMKFDDAWKPKDNFPRYFFLSQLKRLQEFRPPAIRSSKPKLTIVEEPNSFLKENMSQKEVYWDTETSGFDAFRDSVICITMSFDGKEGFYLPFEKIDIDLLSEFFKGKYSMGANLKFDIRFLYAKGVRNLQVDFDTLNAGHCLNEIRPNSLTAHSYIYTRDGGYDKPLKKFKIENPRIKSYADIPQSILFPYATMDSVVGYRVAMNMKKHLAEDPELEKYFYKYVAPTVNMFAEIECQGIPIDWENVTDIGNDLKKQIKEKEKEIHNAFGQNVNLASKQELGRFLERKMKWKVIDRAKDGTALTNDEILQTWKKMGYKEAELIEQHRELESVFNTFIGSEKNTVDTSEDFFSSDIDETAEKGIWQHRKPDGKVYPSYAVMLAKSHRHKCKAPNMQNFPARGPWAKLVRSIFGTPDEDYWILGKDYDGLQLRVAAIISGDDNMINEFKNGDGDLHSVAARRVFAKDMSLEDFKRKVEDDWVFLETDEGKLTINGDKEITVLRKNKQVVIKALNIEKGDDIVHISE